MASNAQPTTTLARTDGEPLPFASEYRVRPIEELLPYARNTKHHSAEQVRALASSLKEFGFMRPVIVDADDTIRAGHGIVLAAGLIGLLEVPTLLATHLSDTQLRAYVLADNKLAELSSWDTELLKVEVTELRGDAFDMELTGFQSEELEFRDWDAEMETTDGVNTENTVGDAVVKVKCPPDSADAVRSAVSDAIEELGLAGVRLA